MNHLKPDLRDMELIDIVPIPSTSDRMVRLRTLDEALTEIENSKDPDSTGYLVQVRRKKDPSNSEPFSLAAITPNSSAPISQTDTPKTHSEHTETEGVYLANGNLNVPFLLKNAELLFSSGEYTLARNIYRTMADGGELSYSSHYWMGRCFEGENKIDEALQHYEQSITFYPSLESYRRLGMIQMNRNNHQLAAKTLERALNLKDLSYDNRFDLHKACGNCWSKARKPEHALNHYLTALSIYPTADDVRSNIGALYLQSQKVPDARKHFQEAITANPKSDKALSGLASCFLAEGDIRQAHDHFARSLEIELNNPTAIFYLVKCAYELKSYATGARILEDYIQIAPINANLLYSLAGLQFHLGRMTDAMETVARILEISPEHNGANDLKDRIQKFEN
ncbi:tetratricopeptide repeat protein [Bdellovibrionota bacterium FG-2]